MKLFLFFVLFLVSIQSSAQNSSLRGGAGVNVNGKFKSFYSANIKIMPDQETLTSIPQLQELVDEVIQSEFITYDLLVLYVQNLRPSKSRIYHKVDPDFFDAVTQERIKEEYIRAFKINEPNAKDVALFAITDFNTNTTFLLPPFYQATPAEQKAFLLHEAYWVTNPNLDYKSVLEMEAAAQQYFEDPKNSEKLLKFVSHLGNSSDYIKAAIAIDRQNGSFAKFTNKNNVISLPLSEFLGAETVTCLLNSKEKENCDAIFSRNLLLSAKKFNNSFFMNILFEMMNNNRVVQNSRRQPKKFVEILTGSLSADLFGYIRSFNRTMEYSETSGIQSCIKPFLNKATIKLNYDQTYGGFVIESPDILYSYKVSIDDYDSWYGKPNKYKWASKSCKMEKLILKINKG